MYLINGHQVIINSIIKLMFTDLKRIDNFQAESCQIYVIRHKIFCSWLLNLTSAFVMEKCQLWTNFVIKAWL